jgi:hypothetical protein
MNKLTGEISKEVDISVTIEGGLRGRDGKSAYELWLDAGNEGSLNDFLSSIGAYIHPETHPASMIEEDIDRNFVTARQKDSLYGHIHEQIKASKTWVISHALDKYPSISVVDSSGNQVIGSPKYIDKNNVVIEFTSEFSGKAYLN